MGDKLGVYGLLSVVVLILLAPLGWRVLQGLGRRQRVAWLLAAMGVGALVLWWAVWADGHREGLWGLLLPLLVPVVMVLAWLGLHPTPPREAECPIEPPPESPPGPRTSTNRHLRP